MWCRLPVSSYATTSETLGSLSSLLPQNMAFYLWAPWRQGSCLIYLPFCINNAWQRTMIICIVNGERSYLKVIVKGLGRCWMYLTSSRNTNKLFSVLKPHRHALFWRVILNLLELSLPACAVPMCMSSRVMHIHCMGFSSSLFSILFQEIFSLFLIKNVTQTNFHPWF